MIQFVDYDELDEVLERNEKTKLEYSNNSMSRIYAVSPMEGERFYLRMLLNIV